MKTLVLYYSRKGSNAFLAHKISETLNCDIEEIKPRINTFLFILMNVNFGIKPIKNKIDNYDKIILCGPIFVGRFITPLKSFIKKYRKQINKLVFVTCCGSTYDKKDEKFGHGLVFSKIKSLLNDKCNYCEAFPIDLVLTEDQKDDEAAFMNTHLSDSNFKGEIQERFDKFIQRIKEIN